MGGGTGTGPIVNLNEQDYTDVVAFATSFTGEFFFAAMFDGVVPPARQRAGKEDVVYIGRLMRETKDEIFLVNAITVDPLRLLKIHRATSYCPRDCLRGLWMDLMENARDRLEQLTVRKKNVTRRFALGQDAPETLQS